MYVDGFETTNPLGSQTQIHKMEGLYMMIRNLPAQYSSKESSTFMIALLHAHDVKNKANAYDRIFESIVNSLKLLESDDSVDVTVNDASVKVRAALAVFSADNLGYHSLFGFLESFSANKFCRLCEMTKADAQTKFVESKFKLRSLASYEAAVARSLLPGYIASKTGIRADCVLNKLRYFHVTENFAVDAMHYLLEGIVPKELEYALTSLSSEGYLSLDEFNSLLLAFDYTNADSNSRP